MSAPLSDSTREQIVRTCRTTLGDELRRVRYVGRDHQERLYTRSDVPSAVDVRPSRPSGDRDGGSYRVVICERSNGATVYIGRYDGPLRRSDAGSLTNFGEVASAIAAILGG